MARSDLLISLVKAGKQTADPRFRSTVEAIIAEERMKQHSALADQLSAALFNGGHGPGLPAANVAGKENDPVVLLVSRVDGARRNLAVAAEYVQSQGALACTGRAGR